MKLLLELASLAACIVAVNSIPLNTFPSIPFLPAGGGSSQKILAKEDQVEVSAIPVGQIITQCTVANTFALTFDDGPYIYTDKILDILRSNNVKATFFVNGVNWGDINDETNKARVRRQIAEGHQVGSHTYFSLLLVSPASPLSTFPVLRPRQRNTR